MELNRLANPDEVRRITFSLRTLLLVASIVCFFIGALGGPRSSCASVLVWLLAVSLPGCLILGALGHLGAGRAFFVGAMLPAIVPLLRLSSSVWSARMSLGADSGIFPRLLLAVTADQAVVGQRCVVASIWLLSVVTGCVAAGVARFVTPARLHSCCRGDASANPRLRSRIGRSRLDYRSSWRQAATFLSAAGLAGGAFWCAGSQSWWIALSLTVFALPACAVGAACESVGVWRGFWLGAVFPASVPLFEFADHLFVIGAGFVGYSAPSFSEIFEFMNEPITDEFPLAVWGWVGALIAGCLVAPLGFLWPRPTIDTEAKVNVTIQGQV